MAFNGKKADPFKPGKKRRAPGLGVKPVKKAAPKAATKSTGKKKGGK